MPEPRSAGDYAAAIMDLAEDCLKKRGALWPVLAGRDGSMREVRDAIADSFRAYAAQETSPFLAVARALTMLVDLLDGRNADLEIEIFSDDTDSLFRRALTDGKAALDHPTVQAGLKEST